MITIVIVLGTSLIAMQVCSIVYFVKGLKEIRQELEVIKRRY